MLGWKKGDPINESRLTVPTETLRIANCPEGYGPFCRSFNPANGDAWLRDCVNQGVPLRTGTTIAAAVYEKLESLGVKRRGYKVEPSLVQYQEGPNPNPSYSHYTCDSVHPASLEVKNVSMLVDTGCFPTSMVSSKLQPYLHDPTKSNAVIEVASGDLYDSGMQGNILAIVQNHDNQPHCDPDTVLSFSGTSCDASNQELFSVDEVYRDGWKTVLDPNTHSYMEKVIKGKTLRLPFRRGDQGGWFIDLLIVLPESQEQKDKRLQRTNKAHRAKVHHAGVLDIEDVAESTTKGKGLKVVSSNESLADCICNFASHPDVVRVRCVDPYNIWVKYLNASFDGSSKDTKAFPAVTGKAAGSNQVQRPGEESLAPECTKKCCSARTRSQGKVDDDPDKSDSDPDTREEGVSDEELVSCDESRDDTDPDTQKAGDRIRREYILSHKGQRRFRPTKKNLRFGKAKEKWLRLHKDHGHMGVCDDCEICRLVMGSARRMYQLIDPHREDRRGHTWVMDGITFDSLSNEGSQYLVVLRDIASDMIKTFPLVTKDQIVGELEEWIIAERNSRHFVGLDYAPVSLIKTDMAGEWSAESQDWQAMLKRVSKATGRNVEIEYASPCDPKKRRSGLAERTNGIVEATVKSILMEMSLPPEWWEAAVRDVEFLLNRTPTYRNSLNLSKTGDQSSPIELYTKEGYSRDQVYTDLSYYIQVGTPCLVHDKEVKGSDLAPKASWWVAYGMDGGNPRFKDPLTHTTRHSKSYTSFRLRDGLNFSQHLGLGDLKSTRRAAARPQSTKDEAYVVDLRDFYKSYKKEVPPIAPAIVDVTQHGNDDHPAPTVTRTSIPGLRGTAPKVVQSDTELQEPRDAPIGRGSRRLGAGSADEESQEATGSSAPHRSKVNVEQEFLLPNVVGGDPEAWAAAIAEGEAKAKKKSDKAEAEAAKKVKHKGQMTGSSDKFESFARTKLKVPNDEVEAYRQWLLDHPSPYINLTEDDGLVMGLRNVTRLPPNIFLPFPSGDHYRQILEAVKEGSKLKHQYTNAAETKILENEVVTAATVSQLLHDNRKRTEWRCEADVPFYLTAHITDTALQAHQAKTKVARKKVRKKAVSKGGEQPPSTTRQALTHPTRAVQWMRSMDKEFYGLVKLGVLKLGYTLAELKALGITSKPVPIGTVFDHKYDTLTGLIRDEGGLKSRMALKGHPGNMFKDVHYTDTYAATPVGETERVLQAEMVKRRLKRLAFDIAQAYCHANMEEGYDKIILTYPDGYQEWDGDEPLYILMDKNLYGHPAGARNWTVCRDEFINEEFNSGVWSCHHCVDTDPCLFHLKRYTKPRGESKKCETCGESRQCEHDESVLDEMWALIHTDDCDCYGTTDSILQEFRDTIHAKWGVKDVNPTEQLGVKRTVTETEDGEMEVRITMPVFVEGMAACFADDPYYPSNKDMTTPYPVDALPDVRVNKEEVSDDEARETIARGYQRVVGMIMWASRHCFPECQLAASYASRVLSHPSLRDWKAALHCVKWMLQNKNRGILFSSRHPNYFSIFVDASNNPDSRSLCQSGHVAYMMGGPVCWESKRNPHADCAAPRNEYMAMHGVCGTINWVRALMKDAGFEFDSAPTQVYTDSKTALQMIDKDKITRSFKIVRTHYHIAREFCRDGLMEVNHIFGKYNPADLTTKSNPRQRIQGDNGEAGVMELCGFKPINYEGCELVERYTKSEKDSGYD